MWYSAYLKYFKSMADSHGHPSRQIATVLILQMGKEKIEHWRFTQSLVCLFWGVRSFLGFCMGSSLRCRWFSLLLLSRTVLLFWGITKLFRIWEIIQYEKNSYWASEGFVCRMLNIRHLWQILCVFGMWSKGWSLLHQGSCHLQWPIFGHHWLHEPVLQQEYTSSF